MSEPVRIGIDVGGTFTHAVALAGAGVRVLGGVRVPTTHAAPEGVARGVLDALRGIMASLGLAPGQVTRVAHSTTQATNALLEGDASPVGILAVGAGWEGAKARAETALEPLELAPGRTLTPGHRYVELDPAAPDRAALGAALGELAAAGAKAIVAAAAFSVDDPRLEQLVMELASAAGLPATGTHEISQLYGLRVRTRTAVLNAALLPRMLETARRTEEAVRAMGIAAPLVVMRSDGGAMSLAEMRRRPLLTLLSGPAAGVAAALMAARIADGIFLEVGGTSTDISCIVDGRPHYRQARIGEHRLHLNTLDVRTLAVAGGSLPRLAGGKVVAVGPRSAHIAGMRYCAFDPGDGPGEQVRVARTDAPRPGDPADYLWLAEPGGEPRAVTPTCAANFLGRVPEGDPARGDPVAAGRGLTAAGRALGLDAAGLATAILDAGARELEATVRELAAEHAVARPQLVGGGGGAGVWVPALGARMGLPHTRVEHAEVISAIGAAVALLQETIERTLVDPGPEDLAAIRQEAEAAVVRAGARPESVEVRIEVEPERGLLRAVALGSHDLGAEEEPLPEAELAARAAALLGVGAPELVGRAGGLAAFAGRVETTRFFGWVREVRTPWRVLDRRGRVRLSAGHGILQATRAEALASDLASAMERYASYGDGGRVLPPTWLLAAGRTVDLSGLETVEQMLSVCREESARLAAGEPAVLAIRLGGGA